MIPIVAFFNNKGGVGKTSLAYHLSWMLAELGQRVLAADLDPQANLTAMFLEEDRFDELWPEGEHPDTVYGALQPLIVGTGDVRTPHVEPVSERIGLLPGDMNLSSFEADLSSTWPLAADGDPRAFRVLSAFFRLMQAGAAEHGANVVLMDVGPNLGAINRAALIAADFVIAPVAPDIFSLQGLRILGPALRKWRREWESRKPLSTPPDLTLPAGKMAPMGYVLFQHAVRLDRPTRAYDRWAGRIPATYREAVLHGEHGDEAAEQDCLAKLKHYRSLMPLAQDAHKPVFFLKAADGAIGAHAQSVVAAYRDFHTLARAIAIRAGLTVREPWEAEPIGALGSL